MINKSLLLKFHEAASMQRWNDQIRVVELTELDKQAHKMIISYVLSKLQENSGSDDFDWIEMIEAGIFEYLQRTVLTDLKPPLFHRIKEDRRRYLELNKWVYEKIYPLISCIGEDFCLRFKAYLMDSERNQSRRVISAAHFYATKWEFDIIEQANMGSYGIGEIKKDISLKQEAYQDLSSMRDFLLSQKLRHFINICGRLRFQIRWSHLHRVPKTSVLGHMLMVAMLSYLFSLQRGFSRENLKNNYLTGLFHDLPEALTRDIINPVKKSVEGLRELIKEYEIEEMEKKIYTLFPPSWHSEIRLFTESEFSDAPDRNGVLVKAVDDLCAFIEVYLSIANGVNNPDLFRARDDLVSLYADKAVDGVDFGAIYREFS